MTIGETLRRERMRRNLDLETISHELKISSKMLEAIEDERFERLPGGVFAKAFVRQYAHILGLDEEEMANEVQRQLQPAPEVSVVGEPVRPGSAPIQVPRVEAWDAVRDSHFKWSSSLPALALVVAVMMGCAGVYSWWQRARHSVSARYAAPPVAAPAPPAAQSAAEASVQATVPEQPQTPTPANPGTPAAASPIDAAGNQSPGTPAAADRTEAAQAMAKPAEAKPAAAPLAPQAPSNPNAPVRVELVAAEPVWVLAKSDGKYLFSGTIEANQTRMLEANSEVTLRLGNAGGVSITLNGKPIGSIGPKGQVRTVQLTPEGFEVVATPKPPVAPIDQLP
jgi:cytoskeleton protein RodZ